MEPIRCGDGVYADKRRPWERTGWCQNVGTPATMYLVPTEADFDPDAGLAGEYVQSFEPRCEACARRYYDTHVASAPIPPSAIPSFESEVWLVQERNGYVPTPTDEDLATFAQDIGAGCSSFEEEAFELARENGERVTYTTVPYGSTTAAFADGPEYDDLPAWCGLEVAARWWALDLLEWARDLSPIDGSMYLVLADDNNEAKEGAA